MTCEESLPNELQREMKRQATPELMRRCSHYAHARVALVRDAGRAVPSSYAHELVHDAYADTWFGAITWVPARASLFVHLCGVIRRRTWLEARHGRRFPHRQLPSAMPDVRFASLGDIRPVLFASLLARVCTSLRDVSAADPAALQILWCWENGVTDRVEAMRITGLCEIDYNAARKRLLYRCDELPFALCDLVHRYLRRAS